MRQALGKGLEALIPAAPRQEAPAPVQEASGVRRVPVTRVRPNRLQPRRQFAPQALEALAASIKAHGLAQPIVVAPDGDGFELIAGERRWRAAQLAGLSEIEAVVRPALPDTERLALALLENLQREDLNPIEEALGFKRLLSEFGYTQEKVAESMGRSRPAVSNLLRLLDLSAEIQDAIKAGVLSEGHGRALLMVPEPRRRALWQKAAAEGWTVRQLERAASARPKPASNRPEAPPETQALESGLQRLLGTKVELRADAKGKGSLRIHFYSLDDFDRILTLFKKAGL